MNTNKHKLKIIIFMFICARPPRLNEPKARDGGQVHLLAP
jgi:hypothetical protein